MTISASLKAHFAIFARVAHIPVLDASEGAPQGSRYFGKPWLPVTTDWPLYEDEPMNFILQIDLAEIPPQDGLPRSGLLSLFVAEDWEEDFSHAACFISPVDGSPAGLRDHPEGREVADPVWISHYMPVVEHPGFASLYEKEPGTEKVEDHPDLANGELDDLMSDWVGMVRLSTGEIVNEKEAIESGAPYDYHCFYADKLGGWPNWMQGPETPNDSNDEPMIMVMQLGGDGGLVAGGGGMVLGEGALEENPYLGGRGHIFYSPKTGELLYGYACD